MKFVSPRGRPLPVTARGWAVLGLAFLLYLAANQTQVSWLYVFAALGAGIWLAAAGVPGAALRALSLRRTLSAAEPDGDAEVRVGDPVTVTLTLHNASRWPAAQVRGAEICAFAPAAERDQTFFVDVPAHGALTLRYTVPAARRGWFEFAPVPLTSRAPFGFWAAARPAPAPGAVLIFPEYRELPSLPVLDRRPAAQNPYARIGAGSEFLGVREYRPGDSPRHVHWRTSARVGRLVVREFAEETQPGVLIALDVHAASVIGPADDNTLERTIKVAATLVHYADRRGLAVSLAAASEAWPAPVGPLSRWAALSYLARVAGDGGQPFETTLRGLAPAACVAALMPRPDEAAVPALLELKGQGVEVLAVVVDPAPFDPAWAGRAAALAGQLRAAGVSVRVVGAEPDWERSLAADDRAAVRW
ncbi:MAG: DUF58 domain-containing protein [Anaerolineales bacterium]|nr:DUF58 domain-containing protein [Anaerolineales bacterium]